MLLSFIAGAITYHYTFYITWLYAEPLSDSETLKIIEDRGSNNSLIERQNMNHIPDDMLNVRDEEGKTPLFDAYLRRDFSGMQTLVERGADINIPDVEQGSARSVVYYLTKDHDPQAVEFLVWLARNEFLNRNERYPDGRKSYLEDVVFGQNIQAYEDLLNLGFDPWIKSIGGQSHSYSAGVSIRQIEFQHALFDFGAFDRDEPEIIADWLDDLLFDSSEYFREFGHDRHKFLIRLRNHPKFTDHPDVIARIQEGRDLYGWE